MSLIEQWCDSCKRNHMCERLYYKNGPPCELYTNEKTFPTDEKPSGRGLCLSKAMGIINGGDEKIGPNGKPEDSFQTTADLWNAYCKGRGMITHFKKSDTAMMMDLLKTARFTGQKYNPDNCVDKAGYTGLADDFKKEEAKTNGK